ncbi:uncharacterized protein LOC133202875 [Saccostrea echinata]|uniref:uncharacterized protein LOC133202875 n=1 Tax=Saccostrea echinata TaxID=191078 RepID=UPI002A7FEC94|nr:uncharacterized protein LOC133202875 [Saccostrea echinata]
MQSEGKKSTEMGKKSKNSAIENRNKAQNPNTVKYFYFDKDGRQLSEETVEKLKINVKGNVVLASGLAGTRTDGSHTDPPLSENVTVSGTQKTSLQQANMKPEASGKPEKPPVPNFQASHNGQIYLVTPDGGLRSAIGNPEIRMADDDQKKQNIPKIMPGTNIEYRSNGTNYLNRNGKIKRPMNAFMLWAREFRGKLAEQMPNASNAEISVGLGQVWANLPASEKQYFYLEAERIKNQHRRDFPGWVYQPNITKRQNQKDAQHTRLWQRFVNNKEASGSKESDKESTYRPIAPATQQNEQSGDNISSPEPKEDEGKKSQETVPSKSSANSENTQTKIQVKPTQNLMTLEQQKQQQESKIDAQTIQSTVKQVVVSSSPQIHNQNPIPTFRQFKQELVSSEKLRNIASYVQKHPEVQPGERTAKAPPKGGNMACQLVPFTTATQTKTHPTVDFRGHELTNQVDRPGRPNSVVMKYNYIPGSMPISLIPTTKPLVSSTVAVPSTRLANQLSQPTQQQFVTLETQKPLNHRSWTMMNQSVSQQKADPADLMSQPVQTARKKLQSNSSDHLQFPIAIPNIPNMNDKTDPLWPFPFPPVEQIPQTHLLYEGTVPDTVYSKTDLSDPYAPFYFDNYINQIRATELQVDVNGWQQYLDDGKTNGAGKQTTNYFSNVKQCPSDLEICPSPASHTLSRNQESNINTSNLAMWPASSTASVNKQHKYISLELDNGQQNDFALSTKRTPSSTSVSQDGITLQPSTSAKCQETPMQQTEVIQALQDTGVKSSFVPQERDLEITSKQTSSENVNGTMVRNFQNCKVTNNLTYYTDDTVNICEPGSSMPKNQEKTDSIEFGSIMSNAVNALQGELDAYESTSVTGYNESSMPNMYSESDVSPLCAQPSASNENFQVSKYQVENNRPIKKRSYKIIEGLLENEVWMSQFRPKTSSSSTSQTQCSVEMIEEPTVSNREEATESNSNGMLGENKNKTKDVLLEENESKTKDQLKGELLKNKDNKTEDQNKDKPLEEDKTQTKYPNRDEIIEDNDNKAKDPNKEELLKDNENTTDQNRNELLEVTNNKTEEDKLHNRDQDEEDGKINEESSTIVCDGRIEIYQECELINASNNVADTTGALTSSNQAETVTDGVITLNEIKKGGLVASIASKRERIEANCHKLKDCPKESSGARNEDNESIVTCREIEDDGEQLDVAAEAVVREVKSAELGENSDIKQEIRKKGKREFKTHLQEDTNVQILEEKQECDNGSKEEFQHFEIVIDNAEKMSSTSCEKLHLIQKAPSLKETDEMKTFSTKISSAQMSEIFEDGDSSTDDEKNEKCNISDFLQHPLKIHKSLNLTQKKKDKNLDAQEHKSSPTKNNYPKGPQSLESGDATISSKKITLESENTSASPGKTRNKRRRPYDSPVRMSKRHK